jgi:hypothetical protein
VRFEWSYTSVLGRVKSVERSKILYNEVGWEWLGSLRCGIA